MTTSAFALCKSMYLHGLYVYPTPQRWLFQGLKTIELPDFDQKEGYISEFCAPVDGPY